MRQALKARDDEELARFRSNSAVKPILKSNLSIKKTDQNLKRGHQTPNLVTKKLKKVKRDVINSPSIQHRTDIKDVSSLNFVEHTAKQSSCLSFLQYDSDS
jgi:hypothetical protein